MWERWYRLGARISRGKKLPPESCDAMVESVKIHKEEAKTKNEQSNKFNYPPGN